LGGLWTAGVTVDWAAVRGDTPARRVALPTYPFARTRHWLEATPPPAPDIAEPSPPPSATGESTVVGEIVELWGRLLGSPDIGPDTDFFTVGGESLLFIRMVNQVQRRFAVRIPMEKLSARPTPRVLAELVAA
ncbi:phosphopantetheine-binding protein, partial [Micromonospora sp. NPDC002411]